MIQILDCRCMINVPSLIAIQSSTSQKNWNNSHAKYKTAKERTQLSSYIASLYSKKITNFLNCIAANACPALLLRATEYPAEGGKSQSYTHHSYYSWIFPICKCGAGFRIPTCFSREIHGPNFQLIVSSRIH